MGEPERLRPLPRTTRRDRRYGERGHRLLAVLRAPEWCCSHLLAVLRAPEWCCSHLLVTPRVGWIGRAALPEDHTRADVWVGGCGARMLACVSDVYVYVLCDVCVMCV